MLNLPSTLAFVCVIGTCVPSEAQIYSWTNSSGILMLSTTPTAGARVTQAVAVGPAVHLPGQVGPESSFDPLIRQHADLHGVRADLVRAVIQVESAFNPHARSPKGAMGLMQLMPSTAAELGVIDAYNPAQNIGAGVTYLKQLLTRYDDNEQLALAAYNAGPGAVDKYGSTVPPYKETQTYVRRITDRLRRAPPARAATRIYKTVETVDGRPVTQYTNTRPSSSAYQEVRR